MHWAAQYIGKPYEEGARGPDTFDCWGLLRAVYTDRYKIELPTLPGISTESVLGIHREIVNCMTHDWLTSFDPKDGYAVAMSQSHTWHHVGIYVEADGCKILHCWDKQSVVIDTMRALELRGMHKMSFFKHRLWPIS